MARAERQKGLLLVCVYRVLTTRLMTLQTLDALPPALTRSLSDLKELDAVLTTPLMSIKSQLDKLTESLAAPDSMKPSERLKLLREVVDEMVRYKVGGDDKIRVANGACESVTWSLICLLCAAADATGSCKRIYDSST